MGTSILPVGFECVARNAEVRIQATEFTAVKAFSAEEFPRGFGDLCGRNS
jgi:hypothetical protein